MHQPAAYGQLPPQNQPMQQVSPAYGYGGGIAGQQGYQQPEPIQLHQQPGTSHQMDQQQLALSPFPGEFCHMKHSAALLINKFSS